MWWIHPFKRLVPCQEQVTQEGTLFFALPSESTTRRSENVTSPLPGPGKQINPRLHSDDRKQPHTATCSGTALLFQDTQGKCNSATLLCLYCLTLTQPQGSTACCHCHPGSPWTGLHFYSNNVLTYFLQCSLVSRKLKLLGFYFSLWAK